MSVSAKEPNLADTNRAEAFSNGVFAVAITLLAVEIPRPNAMPGTLATQLLQNWPSCLSYMLTFVYVGIIWLNHLAPFRIIRKVDLKPNFANLLGRGFVMLLPFPTGVMAEAFRWNSFEDQKVA